MSDDPIDKQYSIDLTITKTDMLFSPNRHPISKLLSQPNLQSQPIEREIPIAGLDITQYEDGSLELAIDDASTQANATKYVSDTGIKIRFDPSDPNTGQIKINRPSGLLLDLTLDESNTLYTFNRDQIDRVVQLLETYRNAFLNPDSQQVQISGQNVNLHTDPDNPYNPAILNEYDAVIERLQNVQYEKLEIEFDVPHSNIGKIDMDDYFQILVSEPDFMKKFQKNMDSIYAERTPYASLPNDVSE